MAKSPLEAMIRDVPDFPKKGIIFKDITPLLANPAGLAQVVKAIADRYRDARIDAVVGIESRGFILGAPIAVALGVGFVPVRKPGKLPWKTRRAEYQLEYGSDAVEIHADAVRPGSRVLVVDDLLATGGTMKACCDLVSQVGGQVAGVAFLIELAFLNGRAKLPGQDVFALIKYD